MSKIILILLIATIGNVKALPAMVCTNIPDTFIQRCVYKDGTVCFLYNNYLMRIGGISCLAKESK